MLGWALRRGAPQAAGASEADDTQIEQPDTPAPLFAARAFKAALFGTPAPPSETAVEDAVVVQKTAQDPVADDADPKSPTKPQGILLTPGTGTARRKRVSFGHDVKSYAGKRDSKNGLSDDISGKVPSPWEGKEGTRPKTRLTAALESSRKQKKPSTEAAAEPETNVGDEIWEEVEELDRDPDVTVDLNEPHSRSGKYWKSYFETYHADAKAEMEKLVKYKQLAKSYAKKKDTEAFDLNQKLQGEKEKVLLMEEKVAELARQVSVSAKSKNGTHDTAMVDDLAKQTALAIQFRSELDEFEAIMNNDKANQHDDKAARRRAVTSPRTQKTLLETQRELRKARLQIKELGELKEEIKSMKSELRFSEQRSAKVSEENKKLTEDMARSSSRVKELEQKLAEAETQSRQKDRELRKLRQEHDTLKDNAKTRFSEAERVLQTKNRKISDLQNEIESLKLDDSASNKWTARARELEGQRKADRERGRAEAESSRQRLQAISDLYDDGHATERLAKHRLPTSKAASTELRREFNEKALDKHTDDVFEDTKEIGLSRDMPLSYERPKREESRAEGSKRSSSALVDLINFEKPARSASGALPRSAAYQPKAASQRLSELDDLPSLPKPGSAERRVRPRSTIDAAPAQRPEIEVERPSSSGSEPARFDLMKGNFARLGGPAVNTSAAWSMDVSRMTLPADRRAAAIARLERKRAERLRAQTVSDRNKENVHP